ncbi:MAG: cache domain-containing protein [Desulfobacterales bacterium]|nr:cache domain-containing protein [Desulfobacterales bacterium]
MNSTMKAFPRWMAVAQATALLMLIIGGAWFYHDQEQALQLAAEEQLTSIARLKVDQIAAWRAERLGDAAVLMESQFLAQGVARFLANPDDANTQPLSSRLRSLQAHYQYIDALLVDPHGIVLLSLTGETTMHKDCGAALAAALRGRKSVLGELYIGTQTSGPYLSVVAPIFSGDAPDAPPLGAVVLISDASQFLYPLIQSWPTPSKTAETLLVRRDGESALFLNDLRHQPDAVLKQRIPLSRTDVPAVMAVLGRQGVFQGKDYRGVAVLAVLLPVPDSPWFMVAKQDKAEVFAEWRLRAFLILALFAAMAGGGRGHGSGRLAAAQKCLLRNPFPRRSPAAGERAKVPAAL